MGRNNVDASSGAYTLTLPVAQPRLATYSTRLPLTFNDGGSAAKYTLEAAADGYAAQTQAIDLTSVPATWNVTLAP